MYARVYGEVICGVDGVKIAVEADVANGLPGFDIVGLPTAAVKESRERVKAALRNSGYPFPQNKITVNLAPADLKKEGAGLDLPIALGIMVSCKVLRQEEALDKIFVGELSLDGSLRKTPGVLPMIIEAKNSGFKEIYIPEENAAEGRFISGIKVYAAANIGEVIEHLQGKNKLAALLQESILCQRPRRYDVDFAEVKGQPVARRALEIAAAGGHSILMVGAPGCGKTMLAKRLVTIMPPMTEEEALEVTKIYSVANLLPEGADVMLERPFRDPHHNISGSALLGGGSYPRPGEVTLSHNGVLFLDEFPEFDRHALEMLRQPLEEGCVHISRVKAALTFPSRFLLCCAQNPCPCGYFGTTGGRKCTCTPQQVANYRRKISGPLLDRIDLQINLQRVAFEDLKDRQPGECSAAIRERVVKARLIQQRRLAGSGLYCNAQMGRREVSAYCQLGDAAQKIMEKYFAALRLSARSHDRVLKVARTIADLAGSANIEPVHIAEALQLRFSLNG